MTNIIDMTPATDEDYIVMVDGVVRTMLNPHLALVRGVNTKSSMSNLRELHISRIKMEDEFERNKNTKTFEEITKFLSDWRNLQFKLQAAWNFPLDENFHRFFDIQSCSCHSDYHDSSIQRDNYQNYPHGPYRYSPHCILHKHLAC